jgi:carbamoyl-phosphate synthase large subunit
LPFFAKHKSALAEHGIDVMVSSPEAVEICLDKLLFSEHCEKLGVPAIPSFKNLSDCSADHLVVKERFGAGALSIGLNLNRGAAEAHSTTLDEPIFQPFVQGKEVSVDAYISKSNEVKGVVVRERVVVVNGESQVSTTIKDAKLAQKFEQIFSKLQVNGHVILQALIMDDGEIQIIECNARFGGASTTSIAAGLDSFYWAYLEATGNNIANYPFVESNRTITQVRFPADQYI